MTARLGDAVGRAPPGPILAVLAVAMLWALGTFPTALARVPDLAGAHADAAATLVAESGFGLEVVLTDAGGTPGTVVGQRPRAGSFETRGSLVTIEVTRGARQVAVPDLAGLPVGEARGALEGAGLRMGDAVYRVVEGAERGRVVSTDPPAGTQVDEGTEVAVVSALG